METVKKLLRDRAGGISIIFIGLVFILLLISFLIMEMGAAYENYYDSETILLRCCNSAVEKEISDAYRADNILHLDVSAATADFKSYLASDMSPNPARAKGCCSTATSFFRLWTTSPRIRNCTGP